MKVDFCAGTCTSSRIESKHKVYKAYMKSSTRLTQLLSIFQNLELQEYTKYKEEVEKISKDDQKALKKMDIIKHFEKDCSSYSMKKLKNSLLESVNYSAQKIQNNLW